MANIIVAPRDLSQVVAALAAMSTETLRTELARQLEVTATHLLRLAAIVRVLEERGEDLSDLKIGLIGYLRQIAYGQVLPEVVVRYAESPMLIRQIARLPLPDQERLARGEGVEVHFRRTDGEPDVRKMDPLRMSRDTVYQVFGNGRIRTQSEQMQLADERSRKPVAKPVARHGKASADRTRGGIVVGRTLIAAADALAALADLHGPDEAQDETLATAQLVVHMTVDQHARIKIRAAEMSRAEGRSVTMSELVRRALRASGLLGESQ